MEMNLKQRQLSILVDYWAHSQFKILLNKGSNAWNATACTSSISNLVEGGSASACQVSRIPTREEEEKKEEEGRIFINAAVNPKTSQAIAQSGNVDFWEAAKSGWAQKEKEIRCS